MLGLYPFIHTAVIGGIINIWKLPLNQLILTPEQTSQPDSKYKKLICIPLTKHLSTCNYWTNCVDMSNINDIMSKSEWLVKQS